MCTINYMNFNKQFHMNIVKWCNMSSWVGRDLTAPNVKNQPSVTNFSHWDPSIGGDNIQLVIYSLDVWMRAMSYTNTSLLKQFYLFFSQIYTMSHYSLTTNNNSSVCPIMLNAPSYQPGSTSTWTWSACTESYLWTKARSCLHSAAVPRSYF